MKKLFILLIPIFILSCSTETKKHNTNEEFQWEIDRFADLKILRYQVDGFDQLTLDQKKLVYYLTQAGLAGRDIIYDTNYRHNLKIRNALSQIVNNFNGDKKSKEWKAFMEYTKRIWFSNGIHHHYSMDKFTPEFSRDYFSSLLTKTKTSLSDEIMEVIFNPDIDAKKISLDDSKDLLLASAVNFYGPDVSEKEAQQYYEQLAENDGENPVSHGLNSTLLKSENGIIYEEVWNIKSKYGPAIKEIISWLEKATEVAENEEQKNALELLIKYYETGDLKTWDEYNIAWVNATDGDIDYINSFIEVYNDPIAYKGSYESIVQINDFAASDRMKVLSDNAQWFEDHSTILPEHKKDSVVGVTYKVVVVAGESGDASPATPIGVNLPNANWIRSKYGSKSVSLGNIIDAYNKASGPGMLNEFAHDDEEILRAKEFGELADKLSTALHEVIGHASGQIEPGIGTPKQTLKNYSSTLEEARADIVALYFIMDPKMMELGLLPSIEAAKAEYDGFISNGLLKQLRRIELGNQIEESHMRNRQLISKYAYEKGKDSGVIERVEKDGKTYFDIKDYDQLRSIFGELLTELQRIKSQGDYEAGKSLVENYGVQVDLELHKQVLKRVETLNSAPYSGFVNPEYKLILDDQENLIDIKVEYPDNFVKQMLEYDRKFGFLTSKKS